MPIVVNTNASATEASFNLSKANESLRKSLARLSSGKRITEPGEDAAGLAVAYKLQSRLVVPKLYFITMRMPCHFFRYKMVHCKQLEVFLIVWPN